MLTMPILAVVGAGAAAGADAPWARATEDMAVLSPRLRARFLIVDVTNIAFTCSLDSCRTTSLPCIVLLQSGPKAGQIPYGLAGGAAAPGLLLAAAPLPAGFGGAASGFWAFFAVPPCFGVFVVFVGVKNRALRIGNVQDHGKAVGFGVGVQYLHHLLAQAVEHFLLGLLSFGLKILVVTLQCFLLGFERLDPASALLIAELIALRLKLLFQV